MVLKECILIKNGCYKENTKMKNNKPTGIVVHSTGCNNPTIKRYVQPVVGQENYKEIMADLGKNKYGNHWNQSGISKCVHAFIGKNEAGKIETYQTLPWTLCPWGCGGGKKGSYNVNPNARIQFEICEDNLKDAKYFNAAFKEAIELCAYLCKKYNLTVDKICSHKEAHDAGYGSNHGDPHVWLKRYGKDMNWFRSEVAKLLKSNSVVEKPAEDKKPETSEKPAVAPKKEYYRVRKTWTDSSTSKGSYLNVEYAKEACDKAGKGYYVFDPNGKIIYPVASATPATKRPTLKQGSKNDDVKELQTLLNKYGFNCGTVDGKFGTKTTKAVKEFQKANKLTVDGIVGAKTWAALFNYKAKGYCVKVTVDFLNVRKGASTSYAVIRIVKQGALCTVVDTKNGWGMLSDGGWISLDCTKRV